MLTHSPQDSSHNSTYDIESLLGVSYPAYYLQQHTSPTMASDDNERVERRKGPSDRRISPTDRRGNDRVIPEPDPRRQRQDRRNSPE